MRLLSSLAVALLGGTLVCAAQAPAAPAKTAASSPAERSALLKKLFAEYWEFALRESPERATSVGDKRYNDRWTDYSANAVNARLARENELILRLGAVDTSGLSEADQLSSQLLLRSLIDNQEEARFKTWEMPVDQFNGPQTGLPQTVAITPFDDAHDFDAYLARLEKVPALFGQLQEVMSLGVDEGRTPPRLICEQVLQQVTTLAAMKPEESPFALPLKKFPSGMSAADQKRYREAILAAISRGVLPSYDRFGRFLKAQYIPRARTEPGAWALPDGDAYYAFRVRQSTTTTKTPDEIHKIGLAEVERDEAEMLSIAKRLGFPDLKSFNTAVKSNPKLHATSPEGLIGTYQEHLTAMEAKLPQLFGKLPKAPVEIERVPAYMEKQQAAAYYEPGTPDGKRPGRIFINTYNFAGRGLQSVEAIAYHEGVPGHHLQVSIAQEQKDVPEFRKHQFYTAYVEGWGLYSERLGKDIGFYQDPYSDYGRLEADIWRAIRLVVDTGVHSKHWSRQQMVDFFRAHSSIDETNVQAETDRYIAWPAQALGYKMGQLKLVELRERAQSKLGSRFKLSDYHDLVVDTGALPLDVLEQRVDTWIARGGGKS